MEKKLLKLLDDFQYGSHPSSILLSSIMKFFQLNYDPDICFGLGCGLGFELPGIKQSTNIPYCFNIHNFSYDLAYSTGNWCIEYRTYTSESFWKKLNDKWFEWVKVHQPMPIYIILPKIVTDDYPSVSMRMLEPYILIDNNIEEAKYSLLNHSSDIIHISYLDAFRFSQNEFYYAIFHPPLNFITDPNKFIGFSISLNIALERTVQKMLYGHKESGIDGMKSVLQYILSEKNEQKVIQLIDYYYYLCQCNHNHNGLYRKEFGLFLIKAGKKESAPLLMECGKKYLFISSIWTELFELVIEYHQKKIQYESFKRKSVELMNIIIQNEKNVMIEIETFNANFIRNSRQINES